MGWGTHIRRAVVSAAVAGCAVCARGTPQFAHDDGKATPDLALIEALGDDDERWNATEAMSTLVEMIDPPIGLIERALDSNDRQRRQLAAHVLWRLIHPRDWDERDPAGHVTPRLLEVTVEGLRADSLPWDRESQRYTDVWNAAEGLHMLSLHAREARAMLERGLSSKDRQQQLLCALALGLGGVTESAGAAAPVLMPHLRDNDIPEDAKWAVAALYRLGDGITPVLDAALPGADDQQRDLIFLLKQDLASPPATRQELEERALMHHITATVFDPAVSLPLDDCMWWLHDL